MLRLLMGYVCSDCTVLVLIVILCVFVTLFAVVILYCWISRNKNGSEKNKINNVNKDHNSNDTKILPVSPARLPPPPSPLDKKDNRKASPNNNNDKLKHSTSSLTFNSNTSLAKQISTR
jgi:hypothetical protein